MWKSNNESTTKNKQNKKIIEKGNQTKKKESPKTSDYTITRHYNKKSQMRDRVNTERMMVISMKWFTSDCLVFISDCLVVTSKCLVFA